MRKSEIIFILSKTGMYIIVFYKKKAFRCHQILGILQRPAIGIMILTHNATIQTSWSWTKASFWGEKERFMHSYTPQNSLETKKYQHWTLLILNKESGIIPSRPFLMFNNLYVHMHGHTGQNTTCGNWFSSFMWIWRIKLRLSGLVASVFIFWGILMAYKFYFW